MAIAELNNMWKAFSTGKIIALIAIIEVHI